MEMTAIGVPSLLFSTPFPCAAGHRVCGTSSRREKVRNRMNLNTRLCQKQAFFVDIIRLPGFCIFLALHSSVFNDIITSGKSHSEKYICGGKHYEVGMPRMRIRT